MTIPNRYRDSVEVAAQHGHPRAVRLLAEDKASRGRRRVKAAPRVQAVKESKAYRREADTEVRAAVMTRANGKCEICGFGFSALEWHHLAPASMRRRFSGVNATCAACRDCHRDWHENDPATLRWSYLVAERIGAPDIVLANLNRRIQKATP